MKALLLRIATAVPVAAVPVAAVPVAAALVAAVLPAAVPVAAQVSYERILNAASEPGSWLTYSGSYGAQRYSTLDQIDRDNVARLQPAWIYQVRLGRPEAPLSGGGGRAREIVGYCGEGRAAPSRSPTGTVQ